MKVICIGNFPPRKCGIATFTENLVKSIVLAANNNSKELELELVAMNDKGKDYDYPPVVKHVIRVGIKDDYLKIAGYINNESNADLCLFQHEYGIYGGESGLFVLNLLKRVRVPIVSTFHTVLQKPTFHQREVLQKIGEYSSRVVVMSSLAIEFLVDVYKMPRSKIARIEHGVPDFAKVSEQSNIKPVEWIDRKILLTFGLLSRNKGIETVIKALPSVVEKFPETLYVVLGKTHPHVVEFAGEEYRDYLKQLTADLNLADHVLFLDKYVSEEELMNYLLASDIYVTPYLNKAQITSGTLAYAVSGGSAVISTPYWHAVELLADGRGRLFNFGDYKQLAEIINDLLANPKTLDTMKKEAYNYGLLVAWPKIGAEYLGVFEKVFLEKQNNFENGHRKFLFSIPDFHLSHLENLTDDTGIVQHARACIPNYNTGYCLDDNTRALIVCLMAYHRFGDIKYLKLISRYLAYIMYMQNSDGSFKNYLTYWRTTIEEFGSDDAYGRSVWALGYLVRFACSDSHSQLGMEMFYCSTKQFQLLRYARGFANCILGLYHYIKRFPDQEYYLRMLESMADNLCQRFKENSQDGWDWFEPTITYDNGILPAALYYAYELTENDEYLKIADRSASFLEGKCFTNGWLSIIGNGKWPGKDDEVAEFAQQPVDAMAMLMMYEIAYKIKNDNSNLTKLKYCFEWFFGNNDLNLPLYDNETHGCNDGLEERGVNRNQGAESTVAYLMSWLIAEPYITL